MGSNLTNKGNDGLHIESISAITLATHDVAASIHFYQSLGFKMLSGGESEPLTSFEIGGGFLNILKTQEHDTHAKWGRVILYVSSVDAMYDRCVQRGWKPENEPADAPWGERFFHITDPAGHEISFAMKLE